MPFGPVFASVLFLFLAVWAPLTGAARSGHLSWVNASVGALFAALGLAVVLRQRWARFACLAAAIVLIVRAWFLMAAGWAFGYGLFFASALAVVLLAIPSIGDPRRGLEPDARPFRRTGRVLAIVAGVSLASLVASVWGGTRSALPRGERTSPREATAGPSAEERGRSRIQWLDYASGLAAARQNRGAVFVDFYASWCGPCKMMERKTFKDAAVAARLSRMATVRVDCEDETMRNGTRGVDLAERFAVETYPTLVLLDSEGREVARRTGYVGPEELLVWLERHVPAG